MQLGATTGSDEAGVSAAKCIDVFGFGSGFHGDGLNAVAIVVVDDKNVVVAGGGGRGETNFPVMFLL